MQSGNTLIEGAAVTGQSAKKSLKKRSKAGKKKVWVSEKTKSEKGLGIVKMQDRSGAGDGITPEPRRHARIPKQTASSGLISSAVVFFNIDSVMRIMCVILGVTGGNATVHLCDLRNVQSYRSN